MLGSLSSMFCSAESQIGFDSVSSVLLSEAMMLSYWSRREVPTLTQLPIQTSSVDVRAPVVTLKNVVRGLDVVASTREAVQTNRQVYIKTPRPIKESQGYQWRLDCAISQVFQQKIIATSL